MLQMTKCEPSASPLRMSLWQKMRASIFCVLVGQTVGNCEMQGEKNTHY